MACENLDLSQATIQSRYFAYSKSKSLLSENKLLGTEALSPRKTESGEPGMTNGVHKAQGVTFNW